MQAQVGKMTGRVISSRAGMNSGPFGMSTFTQRDARVRAHRLHRRRACLARGPMPDRAAPRRAETACSLRATPASLQLGQAVLVRAEPRRTAGAETRRASSPAMSGSSRSSSVAEQVALFLGRDALWRGLIEITRCSLMSKRKPGGVSAIHFFTVSGFGAP